MRTSFQKLINKGLGKDKIYLTETIGKAERQKKRNKKKITFGWDVFNDESIYKAYEKRTAKLQKDEIDESNLTEEDKKKLEEERLDRLVEDIAIQKGKTLC